MYLEEKVKKDIWVWLDDNSDIVFWSRIKMADYCVNCGEKLVQDDIFCSNCGSEIKQGKPSYSPRSRPTSDYSARSNVTPPKLFRSRNDRWILGVCGGLGRHFSIDPILVRIGFIITFFFYGSSLILYIILVIFIEEEELNSEFAPSQIDEPPY